MYSLSFVNQLYWSLVHADKVTSKLILVLHQKDVLLGKGSVEAAVKCSMYEPTLVSAIGHSQLLDHSCGTAFRPTYNGLTLPYSSSAGR